MTSEGSDGSLSYLRVINDSGINTACFTVKLELVGSGAMKTICVCPADFSNRFTDPNVVLVTFPFSGSGDTVRMFDMNGAQLDVKAVGGATFGGANGRLVC